MEIHKGASAHESVDAELLITLSFLGFAIPLSLLPGLFYSMFHCPFKALTGLPCPTCGMTRTAISLLHLHPVQAIKISPLFTFIYANFALLLLYSVGSLLSLWPKVRITFSSGKERNIFIAASIICVFVNWLYLIRNHI